MNKHRIGALIAAAALTLTFAGTALAASDDITWTGQGADGGVPNDPDNCTGGLQPGEFLFVFTDNAATSASLTVDGGSAIAGDQQGGGAFHFAVPAFSPVDPAAHTVTVTYDFSGEDAKNPQLTLSHACPETTTTTTTDEITTTTTDEITTTTTDEITTTTSDESTTTTDVITTTTAKTTTPSGSTEELTPPQTDTIGSTGSSTVSTGLLLVLAGILAIALVVVPATARNRR